MEAVKSFKPYKMTTCFVEGPFVNWCLLKILNDNSIKEERSPVFDTGLHKLFKNSVTVIQHGNRETLFEV